MVQARLTLIYNDYIACLNERDWTKLGEFVEIAHRLTDENTDDPSQVEALLNHVDGTPAGLRNATRPSLIRLPMFRRQDFSSGLSALHCMMQDIARSPCTALSRSAGREATQ